MAASISQPPTDYARALGAVRPQMVRGAGRPTGLRLEPRSRRQISATPIATGENLFSMQDARNLIRYGGMMSERDYLQMDPGAELRPRRVPMGTLAMIAENGWSARALHPPWRTPVRAAYCRRSRASAERNRIRASSSRSVDSPTISPLRSGRVRPSETPGIGVETKPKLLKIYEESVSVMPRPPCRHLG